jgi:hypothetical protein
MDGGSGLNLIYMSTLDSMGIQWSQLCPSSTPFHGVVTGMEAVPLWQIDLPVTFGTKGNFRKDSSPLSWSSSQEHIRDPRKSGICQVHDSPQLHLPQAEDAQAEAARHPSPFKIAKFFS